LFLPWIYYFDAFQCLSSKDQVGTLESGKIANVIVTNGDPLEITSEVRYLFIRGQLTSLDNRHKRLFEKYSARPKP
jgi:imidazolonepropionase-like amidohydrolase